MRCEKPLLRDLGDPHSFEVYYEGFSGQRYRIEVTVEATGLRCVEWIVARHEPEGGAIDTDDLDRISKTIGRMIADLEATP